MDIAPNYGRPLFERSDEFKPVPVAGIFFRRLRFGWILERTGNWTMPFAVLGRAVAVRDP